MKQKKQWACPSWHLGWKVEPLSSAWCYKNAWMWFWLLWISPFDLNKITSRYLGEKQVSLPQIYKYITPSHVFILLSSLTSAPQKMQELASCSACSRGSLVNLLLLRAPQWGPKPGEGSRFLWVLNIGTPNLCSTALLFWVSRPCLIRLCTCVCLFSVGSDCRQ